MKKPNKEQRLETYKRVLEILENKEVVHGGLGTDESDGLCMYLPCVFLNVNWQDYKAFNYSDTPKVFIEFGEIYMNMNPDTRMNNKWRIKILKEIITKMESQ